jgi:hypothetical protein
MIEDTTMENERHAHHLEMAYPWFSEDLARLLAQRLTSHQLTQLRRELEASQKLLLKREAIELLSVRPGARLVLLAQWANWKEEA